MHAASRLNPSDFDFENWSASRAVHSLLIVNGCQDTGDSHIIKIAVDNSGIVQGKLAGTHDFLSNTAS